MSFILQAFYAPHVRSIREAAEAIDQLGAATEHDRARFARFISAITASYPNDDEPGESAWPEGLDSDGLERAVHVFAVDLDWLDENLMAHVARCAGREELHVLDPQNGILYRADGQAVDLGGNTRRLPEPRPVQRPPDPRALATDITEGAVQQRFAARIVERLPGEGFAPDARWGDARRMRGTVQQSVELKVHCSHDEVILQGGIGLRCRPVTRVWLKGLAADGATFVNQLAEGGWRFPDFRLHASEFRAPPSHEAKALGRSTFARAKDWNGIMAWFDRWIDWLAAEGLEDLARIDRPAAIARHVVDTAQLDALSRRNDLHPSELFHRLVLAGTYDRERLPEWVRGFWDHYSRSDLRSPMPNAPVRIYGVFKEASERLIAWLDTEAFAAEAARLRALD